LGTDKLIAVIQALSTLKSSFHFVLQKNNTDNEIKQRFVHLLCYMIFTDQLRWEKWLSNCEEEENFNLSTMQYWSYQNSC